MMVLEDLNAIIKCEVVEYVNGRYGVPGKNESGDHWMGMGTEQELVVGNSSFKVLDANYYTWVKRVGCGRGAVKISVFFNDAPTSLTLKKHSLWLL